MNKTLTICCMAASSIFVTCSCSRSQHKEPLSQTEKNTNDRSASQAPANAYPVSPRSGQVTLSYAVSDSTSTAPSLSSSAAVEKSRDGMKFVRTADIKFQVSNVTDATYHIEDITDQYGGFVTYTNLHSDVDHTDNIPVSADSSLSVTYYTVQNDINIRIPNKRLDSALRAMSVLVDFLNSRVITATDVSIQAVENDMTERRNREYEQRMRGHGEQASLKQEGAISAEEKALQSREAADNAHIASLSLDNQVRYSTVHLIIYQPQSTRKIKVCIESNIARFRPSFGIRFGEALMSGLEIFEDFAVGLAHLWAFIFAIGIALLAYLKIRKRT